MTTANNGQARPEWHTRSVAETIAALSTTEKGLTVAEAADRLERHGANVLPEPLRPGLIRRFLAPFHNVLIYVLLGAALITLFFIRNFRRASPSFAEVRGAPVIWATVGVVVLAQFAITDVPSLQAVFETRAVPLGDGLMILGAGVALFVVIEVEKQLRLRLGAKRHAGG